MRYLIILCILLAGCQKKTESLPIKNIWSLEEVKRISCKGKVCVEETKKGCTIEYGGFALINNTFSLLIFRYETCNEKTKRTLFEKVNKAEYKVTSRTIVLKDKKYKIHKSTSKKLVLVRTEKNINNWYYFKVNT